MPIKPFYYVAHVINATNEFFHLYEYGSGRMVPFYPSTIAVNDIPLTPVDHNTCYVVTQKQLETLKAKFPDAPLDNLGILLEDGIQSGRHDLPVARIWWAENPEIVVQLLLQEKLPES